MLKKKLLSFAVLATMAFSLAMALPVSAQVDKILDSDQLQAVAQDSYNESTGAPKTGIQNIVVTIINSILGLLGVIFLVLVIYAGFLWMTAGGDSSKVDKAKGYIKNAIIGIIIILAAYIITSFVLDQVVETLQ